MKEIWKFIEGYEGIYQVSNLGRVKSLNRNKISFNGFARCKIFIKGKTRKTFDNKHGYLFVVLSKNGISKNKAVHRLVAQAFIPNPNNMPEVNHKDGNKKNNNVNNLEWVSRNENQQHAWKIGLQKKLYKDENNNSKKINQYNLNGDYIKTWNSMKEIQDTLNISQSTIWRCCIDKYNQGKGYIWKYADK